MLACEHQGLRGFINGVAAVRLFIQIPCNRYDRTLTPFLRDIPRHIRGLREVKIIAINDGGGDKTSEVAYREGADYVICHPFPRGLGQSFATGIYSCLEFGADIIVHTDRVDKYVGIDIPMLIQPILAGEADVVIGSRYACKVNRCFFLLNRKLHTMICWINNFLPDSNNFEAYNGIIAFNREAAHRCRVFSHFPCSMEAFLQAGKNWVRIAHIPLQSYESKNMSYQLFDMTLALCVKQLIERAPGISTFSQPLLTLFRAGRVRFFR